MVFPKWGSYSYIQQMVPCQVGWIGIALFAGGPRILVTFTVEAHLGNVHEPHPQSSSPVTIVHHIQGATCIIMVTVVAS